MADSRLEWHGDDAKAHVNRKVVAVLNKCVFTISGRARELLGVAGTGKVKGSPKRDLRGKFLKNATIVTRSKPGEPPRKQTGTLRRSVQTEVDEGSLTARVGTNVEYGKHLELGTKRGIAPRPWLRRALAESMPKINAWLATLAAKE